MKELALPSASQRRWQDMELGMFCHFGMNTFTGKEWGEGTEPASCFNPTAFDADQWARIAKRAGFSYLILTAKHHDGFCLWPTATTDYSVRSSPWRGGQGDVVGETARACEAYGIGFGVYLSPWDRHEPCYSEQEAYDHFYAEQLTELLTGYGPLVEVWFDGAGSEGRTYDWKRMMSLVERYQPDAMRFNMGIPTIRWVGNEDGIAPYPCWNTAESARVSLFTKNMLTWLPETPRWVPAECDVPIREQSWFWRPNEEEKLLSHERLIEIYYGSVGRGCNLLLNLAPDARGLIPEADAGAAIRMMDDIRNRFEAPLETIAGGGDAMTMTFARATRVDHVVLMEDIAYGERIRSYALEAETADGGWMELLRGSAVGHKKIDRFEPVETSALRLRILKREAEPHIRLFSAYCTARDDLNPRI
ncbi:alpha-L-fucosidase [Paenibacillus sp. HB172176]|uniref:alpha-L-fucosidase n=1 Tax=Paenibacillus sp. HB172176 TaxID=2493690 RepID=UPI00143BD5E8|nr:alpha-L-fucosidase [Paenibacillus sp. HB172176]